MSNFEFSWKFKDYEIRTRNSLGNGAPYVELIMWDTTNSGKKYCFTLAYFYKDKDGYYELHFVGDRPYEYIAEINIGEIWKQLWLTQQLFEDAEKKSEDDY